jgi:hypothetical protein
MAKHIKDKHQKEAAAEQEPRVQSAGQISQAHRQRANSSHE